MLHWVAAFLFGCRKRDVLPNDSSTRRQVRDGAPQGSIPRLLPFIMGVNDISDIVRDRNNQGFPSIESVVQFQSDPDLYVYNSVKFSQKVNVLCSF